MGGLVAQPPALWTVMAELQLKDLTGPAAIEAQIPAREALLAGLSIFWDVGRVNPLRLLQRCSCSRREIWNCQVDSTVIVAEPSLPMPRQHLNEDQGHGCARSVSRMTDV